MGDSRIFIKIRTWAQLIRDLSLILGVPTIIYITLFLHNEQIDALKAQLSFAESTSYDRALSLIESQKKLYILEFEAAEKHI